MWPNISSKCDQVSQNDLSYVCIECYFFYIIILIPTIHMTTKNSMTNTLSSSISIQGGSLKKSKFLLINLEKFEQSKCKKRGKKRRYGWIISILLLKNNNVPKRIYKSTDYMKNDKRKKGSKKVRREY